MRFATPGWFPHCKCACKCCWWRSCRWNFIVLQLQDRSRNVNGTFMSGWIMSSNYNFKGNLAELLRCSTCILEGSLKNCLNNRDHSQQSCCVTTPTSSNQPSAIACGTSLWTASVSPWLCLASLCSKIQCCKISRMCCSNIMQHLRAPPVLDATHCITCENANTRTAEGIFEHTRRGVCEACWHALVIGMISQRLLN